MQCSQCGNETTDNASFCGNCGVAIDINSTTNATHHDSVAHQKIGFSSAAMLGFTRYFDFRGRSSRAEYWWFVLFLVLVDLALSLFDSVSFLAGGFTGGLFGTLWSIAVIVPQISIGARRLHDINRSGWWLLLLVIPILGWGILLIWAVKQGDQGNNSHGPEPTYATPQNGAAL